MLNKSLGLALTCVAVTAFASQALAQQAAHPRAAAVAAPTPLPTGPAIPGVCLLNNDGVVFGSVVGKFVVQRLNQLKAQSDAELTSEGQGIKNDAQALESKKATVPPDQYQQQGSAINLRVNAIQRKAQLRQREIQATEEKALGRISQEAEPVVRQAFAQHNCSLLLNAGGVIFAQPSMDITPTVVQGLDAKITQFQFDREHLDQQAASAAQ